jgi:hypothetical protein
MSSTSLLVVAAAAGAALVYPPVMVEALALVPSPLAGAHAVLRGVGFQQHYNRQEMTSSSHLNRRRSVSLSGPLNYMNMEQYVDPINVTDPSMGLGGSPVSVLDLVDNHAVLAAVDSVMDGHHRPHQEPSHENGNVISLQANTFLPKELPIVEEDVRVIESPEVKAEEVDHPSVRKIIQFTLPAIGVWLCSPVLSMIDTASVGMLAGTAQQAALNPAVSVTDYGAILVAFMYTATTNLIAGSVEKDREEGENYEGKIVQKRTTETLITALRLALLIGVAFGATLSSFAPKFLSLLIGNDTLDPTVFSSALRYVLPWHASGCGDWDCAECVFRNEGCSKSFVRFGCCCGDYLDGRFVTGWQYESLVGWGGRRGLGHGFESVGCHGNVFEMVDDKVKGYRNEWCWDGC